MHPECLQARLAGGLTNPQVVPAAKWVSLGLSYSGHYRQANIICTSVNAIMWDLANWLVYAIGRCHGRLIQAAFHSECIVAVWDLQDVAVLRR